MLCRAIGWASALIALVAVPSLLKPFGDDILSRNHLQEVRDQRQVIEPFVGVWPSDEPGSFWVSKSKASLRLTGEKNPSKDTSSGVELTVHPPLKVSNTTVSISVGGLYVEGVTSDGHTTYEILRPEFDTYLDIECSPVINLRREKLGPDMRDLCAFVVWREVIVEGD